MSAWAIVGVLLILVGAAIGAPGLLLVGALTILSRWLTTLWSRYGGARIAFERRLGTDRAVWGDVVPLDLEIWNQKALPLPLVTVDDHVTDTLRVRGHRLAASDRPGRGVLRNAWSLLWFERVVRHLSIEASRRGTFAFGPVSITVSDLFERGAASEERALAAQLLVRPRSVPVVTAEPAGSPLGAFPVRASLFHDPARPAGVRAYRPGDPIRRIHWRATAKLRQPVSRRYDPTNDRDVLIALDLQTVAGPHWLMLFDDDRVEALCVAAASLSRWLLADGAACGITVGSQLAGGRQWAFVPPGRAAGQLGRIEDVLARLEPIISMPFERLLPIVPYRVRPGSTLVTLAARDPTPYLDELRRISRLGYGVTHIALGPDRDAEAARAAAAGIPSRTARLDPSWRDADALVVAA